MAIIFPAGFDPLAYWLESLDADPAHSIDGGDCRVHRRLRPGDRMLDLLDCVQGRHLILNGALFDCFAADFASRPVSLAACLDWITQQTGALLQRDELFYPACPAAPAVPPAGWELRLLGEADAPAFATLDAACPADELDAGFVELDHELVAGVLKGGQLLAKASAYSFFGDEYEEDEDGPVWDLGFVTHPQHRKQGCATAAARLLQSILQERGKLCQIRAGEDKAATRAICRKLGFESWGHWSYPEAC